MNKPRVLYTIPYKGYGSIQSWSEVPEEGSVKYTLADEDQTDVSIGGDISLIIAMLFVTGIIVLTTIFVMLGAIKFMVGVT